MASAKKPTVLLVHWREDELPERVARLAAVGYRAIATADEKAAGARRLAQDPPAAIVIDLGRLPAEGRNLALNLRGKKATAAYPIVFVDGPRDKVATVRARVPDAEFCTWRGIQGALRRALRRAPTQGAGKPARAKAQGAGYSGTPLAKKLGIRASTTLALLGAPRDFAKTLGEVPEDVRVRKDARGKAQTIVLFAKTRAELERRLGPAVRALAEGGGLWLAWPKKTAAILSDLDDSVVRKLGLATGLVDNKVCAIDATWSGLRFVRRRES